MPTIKRAVIVVQNQERREVHRALIDMGEGWASRLGFPCEWEKEPTVRFIALSKCRKFTAQFA